YVDFLNGFERRDVRCNVRQLHVVSAHAVDPSVVLVVARPVDIKSQRAGRIRWNRVRVLWRRKARQSAIGVLIVHARWHGKLFKSRCLKVGMDFGCVSLESWGCALHLDSLANRAYLQGHVSANDSVKCYLNVFSLIGLESLARD